MKALLVVLPLIASAQSDVVKVASPDAQIECRLMIAQPPDEYALPRLAYQVDYRGKRLMDTSYLGLIVDMQEPMLGENDGLIASRRDSAKTYNSLVAEYMQNGSLGRRISVEVRAYNDGLAFRYLIPRTSPLEEFRIASEETQFRFAEPVNGFPEVTQPGLGFVAIRAEGAENYPAMPLARMDGRTVIFAVPAKQPEALLKSPFTAPWRVLLIGSDRERVLHSDLAAGIR